jgi:ankyrin repeat protein
MATYGHTETVRALVRECSADVNFPTIDGETPLFIAAHGGHTETVRALVRECSANVKNMGGETPLFRAADYGSGMDTLADCQFGGPAGRERGGEEGEMSEDHDWRFSTLVLGAFRQVFFNINALPRINFITSAETCGANWAS